MKGRVLVVDDEKNVGFVIQAMLDRAGYETLCFQESSLALEAIEGEELDAVITDLYMPGAGGMEILDFCRKTQPQLPVVMITAFGTIESAVNALKQGAFDFITKPFEQNDLLAIVAKAVSTHRERLKEPIPLFGKATPVLVTGKDAASGEKRSESDQWILIGDSEEIRTLRKAIDRIAPTDTPVLLSGETGTGKEVIAQELHLRSPRSEKPLIKVNCAVIPAQLLESELFGSEERPGRIELAQDGTLFIDDVAELPQDLQARLLQVIQDKTFERAGALQPLPANVRLLFSSHRDLEEEVKRGRFRQDLFYALNAIPLRLPSLRERLDDIEALVRACLVRCNTKYDRHVSRIEPEVLTVLSRFGWPGNLRQLENVMERMVLLSEGDTLRTQDLPEEFEPLLTMMREEAGEASQSPESLPFKERVRRQTQNVERELILKALDEEEGNVTRTAEKLGLSRKGLQLKMKELGIRRI